MPSATERAIIVATCRPAVRWFFEIVKERSRWPLTIEEMPLDPDQVAGHSQEIEAAHVAFVDTGNDPLMAIRLCRALRTWRPELPIVALVCCTQPFTPWHLQRLLQIEGGCSVVDGESTVEDLLRSIDKLFQGKALMHLQLSADYATLREGLLGRMGRRSNGNGRTDPERDLSLIALVAAGLSDREIGLRLHLSPHTIHHHIERLRAELAVRNRIELAAWAGCHGIYSPGPAGSTAAFPLGGPVVESVGE
jgi:DNA-binding NarL/FixJ family response regulator